jgi:hypothetical protein
MMHRSAFLMVILLLLGGAADAWAANLACGTSIDDWCPARRGDPCGRHKITAACKADPKCYGMPYRGVSFVPCFLDRRGFASNCPTVGCTSTRPPGVPMQ